MDAEQIRLGIRALAEAEAPASLDLWPAIRATLVGRPRPARPSFALPRPAWMTLAATTFCLVIALTLAVWPSARAAVGGVVHRIAGVRLYESQEPVQAAVTPAAATTAALACGKPRQVPVATSGPSIPFAFRLPSYVPPGFVPDEKMTIQDIFSNDCNSKQKAWQVEVRWFGANGRGEILLRALSFDPKPPAGTGFGRGVGPGGAREVLINNKPVALLTSTYQSGGRWLSGDNILMWEDEATGITYTLEPAGGSVSLDEAIRMAATMR